MTDRTDTHDHAEKALDEMQERSEQLKAQVKDAKEDWEDKKADDRVPGAAGRQEDARSDENAVEADYPTKSSSEDIER